MQKDDLNLDQSKLSLHFPKDGDPFAEIDAEKLIEYRIRAHRALDTLIDYRIAWEASYKHTDDAVSDDGATKLYSAALMFANRLIGLKANACNAEMFDEGTPRDMRMALRKVIQKLTVIWPASPALVSDNNVRRPIDYRDVLSALRSLDRGHTPELCKTNTGRQTDVLKERCRFAGALWSIHLQETGSKSYTDQIVKSFGLGTYGAKTVQLWKTALEDPGKYAIKLGYDHEAHVTHLIARARLVHDEKAIEGFGPYIAFNIFNSAKPHLWTLEGIGETYKSLLVKQIQGI